MRENWWLLLFSGVLQATMSVTYLCMLSQDGLPFHSLKNIVEFLGGLALLAGASTIAAGLRQSARGSGWALVANGLALGALGLIYIYLVGSPISFRDIALLIIVMAVSMSVVELKAARISQAADKWLFGLTGVTFIAFAFAFLVFALRWMRLGPGSRTDLILLGSYFGFSAICMLCLAVRRHSSRVPVLNIPFPISQF